MRPKFKMKVTPMVMEMIDTKLNEMEDFKDFIFLAIEREKKIVGERMKKHTANMTEPEKEEYYDWYAEDYLKIDDIFAQTTINAFIVILYSYLESGLNSLCDAERQDNEITLRYSDMKGKGIQRAKLYLEKVVGIDLHVNENPWREIQALNKLRNAIVHEEGWSNDEIIKDGNIKKCVEKGLIEIGTRQAVKDKKLIDVPGIIKINQKYLGWILSQGKGFFQNIKI